MTPEPRYVTPTTKGPVHWYVSGDPIIGQSLPSYFVTDAWVGVGGHLRRYEVTGPEGHVSLHKTYGEAMAKADALNREEN